jgi:hypothetical protein
MAAIKKPATFDQLYAGRFLKAGTLDGKKVTLTIRDYGLEELEGEDGVKRKAVISFVETPMALIACKTNGVCIKEMFGSKLPDWVGKRVTLFPSQWNGEDCIRVWGSPDIASDMQVEVKLPRRKPIRMTMHAVPGGKTAPKQDAAQAAEAPAQTEIAGGDESFENQ